MNNYNKKNNKTTTPPQGVSPQNMIIHEFFEEEENNKYNMYCMNCGKKGHLTKKCSHPIISLGILCLHIDNFEHNINDIISYSKRMQNNYIFEQDEFVQIHNIYESIKSIQNQDLDNLINYLMIRRKNSLSYVDFMRGKYDIDDYEYVHNTIHLMTEEEQRKLLTLSFDELWKDLWSIEIIQTHSSEYEESKSKFEKLKNGYLIQKNEIYFEMNFEKILNTLLNTYNEPEWGFPKGRRNMNEKNIECAKREFQEETDISPDEYHILNVSPLEEIYLGSNHIRYKHIYYFSQMTTKKDLYLDMNNEHQKIEIGDIKWMTFHEGYNIIREYNREKRNILYNIHLFIKDLIMNFKKIYMDFYEKNRNLYI